MADVLKCSGDAVKAAVEYLQAIKIVEIRQTLELLGVQHIEVIAALLLFVMLQFTKFTAVLLIACSIAYGIFYMWDTWFPEVKENSSATTQNADYGYLYGASFWGSYGPSYGPGNLSRNSISSGINSNYDNTYVAAFAASNRDARTSALFPPFSNSEIAETLPGDHMYDTEEKRINISPYFVPRPDPFNQKKQNPSGTTTPVGQRHSTTEPRPQRRLPAQTSEENRHNRRDPLAFRRLIANDYRMYRPSTSADAQQYYSYSIPVPEERARRLPGFFDDYKMKYRRSNDKRASTQRNASHANEQPWNRQNGRSVSRDNLLHRSRNIQEGFPNHYGSPQGRSNAGNRYNPDSSRKKVRK